MPYSFATLQSRHEEKMKREARRVHGSAGQVQGRVEGRGIEEFWGDWSFIFQIGWVGLVICFYSWCVL